MHRRVQLLALLDPSRQDIPEYAEYLDAIEREARSVNDRFRQEGWLPIDLRIHDDFPESVAAYKQFDVLLVNAIFDGLNLVAKEATLVNERDGVLVLSENAGAHEELGEWALTVNPFDIAGQAEAIHEALSMEPAERRRRLDGDQGARARARPRGVDRGAARRSRPRLRAGAEPLGSAAWNCSPKASSRSATPRRSSGWAPCPRRRRSPSRRPLPRRASRRSAGRRAAGRSGARCSAASPRSCSTTSTRWPRRSRRRPGSRSSRRSPRMRFRRSTASSGWARTRRACSAPSA